MMPSAKKESGGIVEGLPSIPHLAAFQGREDVMQFLAESAPQWLFQKADTGDTAAHIAAATGNARILSIIAEVSSSLFEETDSEGWNACHVAAYYGHLSAISTIVAKSPSSMHAKDHKGLVPWEVARERRAILLLKSLLMQSKRQSYGAEQVQGGGMCARERSQQQDGFDSLLSIPGRRSFDTTDDSSNASSASHCSETSIGKYLKVELLESLAHVPPEKMAALTQEELRPWMSAAVVNSNENSQAGSTSRRGTSAGALAAVKEDVNLSREASRTSSRVDGLNLSRTLSQSSGRGRLSSQEAVLQRQCGRSDDSDDDDNNDNDNFIDSFEYFSRSTEVDGDTSSAAVKTRQDGGWQQDVASKQQEKKWKSLLGSMRSGTDITSMMIPADFLRPESALERIQDTMQHGCLLAGIADAVEEDPVRRLLAVTRFHVSGVIKAIFDGKKPYNPVLGETCAWGFGHGEDGITRMVCEQVSHHPPISALHLANDTLGISLSGFAETSPKFLGNSVDVPFKGKRRLLVHATGEEYTMTVPNLQYRGLLMGSRGAEWVGQVHVRCEATRLACLLKFRPIGWFGMSGGWHRVEGKIVDERRGQGNKSKPLGKVHGHWDRGLFVTWLDTKETEVLYDFDDAAQSMRPVMMEFPRSTLPTDSKVIWEDLSHALHAKDMKAAGKIKNRIEQNQRDVAKAMSGDFEPIFFRRTKGKGKGSEWEPKEDVIRRFHDTHMRP